MTRLTLGFMPLTDCVPMVVAQHYGFFAQWGLDVDLVRQNSWATLRDKLHAGLIDAAQMLAPMPFASTLGLGSAATSVIAPFILSRQGNAITLSKGLFEELGVQSENLHSSLPLPASKLASVIAARASVDKKITFATVFPYSCHYYQLCSWLAQYQIPIDSVNVVIVPPSAMVDAMQSGQIDGFCVGSPWNAHAVRNGLGITAITSTEIWPAMPEKVLGLKARFYEEHPQTIQRLIGALNDACNWLAHTPNRFEAARLLCDAGYLNTTIDVLAPSLLDSCLTSQEHHPRSIINYNVFGAEPGTQNNCPTQAQGEWILNQMNAAGHTASEVKKDNLVRTVFREDIYQCALKAHSSHQKSEFIEFADE